MGESKKSGVIIVGVVLLVSSLSVVLPFYCGWHGAHFGDADDVKRVRFLRDGGGVRLLSAECVDNDGTTCRLTLRDAASGERLARLVRDRLEPACQPAVPGRLWCRDGELGIYLVDSRSLAVVADQDGLIAGNPLLASGLSGFEPVLERAGRGLVVGTNAGLKVRIDPATLEVTQVAEPSREESLELDEDGSGAEYSLEVGGFRYSFEGNASTDRLRLERRDLRTHEDAPLPVSAEAVGSGEEAGADTFLKAQFVRLVEGPDRAPCALARPAGFLVVHQSSLDDDQAQRLLSRVDERGRIVWTVAIPRGRLVAAERIQGAAAPDEGWAVIVVGGRASTALSVRLADGTLLWQARL